ncbi:SCP2 sterol-binding domain-containing protein [Paenibacillus silviterrae]|uniref:SCP2 sterol-binding domain-containing protein n=1 Tax=Paenibacillus silviterrae TaxID=3242194 RepID=UPI00254296E2|nr:SCP2 sterol-binding domain-containing protein [Paenibacillus chinjuensis]
MDVKERLQQLADRMNENPDPIRPLQSVYQLELDAEILQVRFRSGTVEVMEGTPYLADCTLTLTTANLMKLLNNELNAMKAFLSGSLKIGGNLSLAMKLQEVLKQYKR